MKTSYLFLALALSSAGCLPQTGQFHPLAKIPAGRNPLSSDSGDLDGDGKLDLVTTRGWANGEVTVRLGNGDGTFRTTQRLVSNFVPQGPTLADLDGDGKLDLSIADFAVRGFITTMLGNGDGTFQEGTNHLIGATGEYLRSADVNGDGKLDIVACNVRPSSSSVIEETGAKLVVLLGTGDGGFEPARLQNLDGIPLGAAIGDWDGDQKLDAMVAILANTKAEIFFMRGRGDGTFEEAARIPSAFTAVGVAPPADLDKDGKMDLVIGVPSGLSVFRGLGGNAFEHLVDYNTGPTRSSWVADFDKDGHDDIVTARRFLKGDGTGRFQMLELPHEYNNDAALEVADFNGDGWLDIASTDWNRNDIDIYLNKGGNVASR